MNNRSGEMEYFQEIKDGSIWGGLQLLIIVISPLRKKVFDLEGCQNGMWWYSSLVPDNLKPTGKQDYMNIILT